MLLLRSVYLLLLLASVLVLPACESVRTVYDEDGKVVTEDDTPGANETDLVSAFEKRFDTAFSEKRNAQGVPEASSQRVSSFQKELDRARSTEEDGYSTKLFGGLKRDDSRDRSYSGVKDFGGNKQFADGELRSRFSTDNRPDFMNENRGLAHKDYEGGKAVRYMGEGSRSDDAGRVYDTPESRYQTDQQSGYFESRRNDTPAPPIYDHRDVHTREIMNIRNILGRDKTDAQQ